MPIASSLLNKPRLVEKLRNFYDYVQKNDGKVGTKTRGIDLNFNNACNLRCKYCFTNSPKGDHVKEYLDIKAIKKLADEADELGYFEFDLQGGELLLQPKKLFEVLEAIRPERFYMYLTTNGYYLDKNMAKKLADYKVSRVSVSIDSMDEKIHDEIRGRKESWKRAIEALKHVQDAGMDPYLNITVGHYNANTDHFKQLLDYSKDQKYRTLLNVAVPAGMWQKAEEIICDDNDREYLRICAEIASIMSISLSSAKKKVEIKIAKLGQTSIEEKRNIAKDILFNCQKDKEKGKSSVEIFDELMETLGDNENFMVED